MFVLVWTIYAVGLGLLLLGWLAKKTTSDKDESPTNALAGVNNYRHLIALIGVALLVLGAITNSVWESGQYDAQTPSNPSAKSQPSLAPTAQPTATPIQIQRRPTAVCRDGTLSYSQNRRGTCSHHGGVRSWY
jgi:hypothetical protein